MNPVAFGVHSDWWEALGGFQTSVEIGLNTGIWPSSIPLQPNFKNSLSSTSSSTSRTTSSTSSSMLRNMMNHHRFYKAPPGSHASIFELSIRFYCCGGTIKEIQCSNIEHVTTTYRGKKEEQNNHNHINIDDDDDDADDISLENKQKKYENEITLLNRAGQLSALYTTQLWLGKYAPFVYSAFKQQNNKKWLFPDQTTQQKEEKEEVHEDGEFIELDNKILLNIEKQRRVLGKFQECHNLEWYLENINPNLFYPFIQQQSSSSTSTSSSSSSSSESTSKSQAPSKVQSIPVTDCTDNERFLSDCLEWSKTEECSKNVLFMAWACPLTCHDCKITVIDGKIISSETGLEVAVEDVTFKHPSSSSSSSSSIEDSSSSLISSGNSSSSSGGSDGGRVLSEEPWVDLTTRMGAAQLPRVLDRVDVHLLANLVDQSQNQKKKNQNNNGFVQFPPKLDKSKYCHIDDNDAKLLQHITVASHSQVKYAEDKAIREGLVNHRGRVMCIIYCTRSRHGDAVKTVRETWGNKCDGFIAMSDLTEESLPTLNVPHEGKEEYDNIWQKVRSIWLMVYHRYYNEFDWFMIGGDDLYVLVENLRLYLHSDEILQAASSLQVEFIYPSFLPSFLHMIFPKKNSDQFL